MKINKNIILFIISVIIIITGLYFLSNTKYISSNFLPYILILLIGVSLGILYNYILKKNIFGGIIGAIIISIIGGVIGHLAFNDILIIIYKFTGWLMGLTDNSPKMNIIAAVLGSFTFLIILNKINPGNKNN